VEVRSGREGKEWIGMHVKNKIMSLSCHQVLHSHEQITAIHTYTPTYIHTHTYTHTYIHTYIHTHIPTYIHTRKTFQSDSSKIKHWFKGGSSQRK